MCDTIAIVEAAGVYFAKNSDRDANEAQLLEWHAAREHPAGSELRCTWVSIPQARRTHAVLLSRPYWMWGAEMGANAHGLVIGNEAVFTRQPYARTGLTGMDLLRLALERAETADEGVAVLRRLLAEHGQGGGCGHEDRAFTYHNSFIVADPRAAWVVETAGRECAVEPVRGARSISNVLTIADFERTHGDFLKTRVARGRTRRARTQLLARTAQGPLSLMGLLRDHGEGRPQPRYAPLTGCMDAPCMHAGGVAANSQTTASWVAELVPGAVRHWATGTAAPCTGLFKPVRVEEPLDLGPAPADRFDAATLWWRHERLHRQVMRDPARLLPLFAAERDALEAAWVAAPPEPGWAFREADRLTAEWTRRVAAVPATDRRPVWARRYWQVRDRRAGLQRPDGRGRDAA